MTNTPFAQQTVLVVIWLVGTACLNSRAADVVYVDTPNAASFVQQQTKTTADFYGLTENVLLLTGKGKPGSVVKSIQDSKTVAVVLTGDTLPFLDRKRIMAALHRKNMGSIPLLIAGIDESTDAQLLKRWSGNSVTGCKKSTVEKGAGSYRFADVGGITFQLGGNTLPLSEGQVLHLTTDGLGAESIMSATSIGQNLPVFMRVKLGRQEVFFATMSTPVQIPTGASPYRQPLVFASLVPQMIFLRRAGGERAWHSPGPYANLTIDDAWLREPYGYVDYAGLLPLDGAAQFPYHNRLCAMELRP